MALFSNVAKIPATSQHSGLTGVASSHVLLLSSVSIILWIDHSLSAVHMSVDKGLSFYRKYYRSVHILGKVVNDLNISGQFSGSCLKYFNSTLIASNAVFDHNSIKIVAPIQEEELSNCIRKCLNELYSSANYSCNSIRREFVYLYLKSVYLCRLFRVIDHTSLKILIVSCSFFEFVDESYYIQRTGPYFSDFIWNKTLEK